MGASCRLGAGFPCTVQYSIRNCLRRLYDVGLTAIGVGTGIRSPGRSASSLTSDCGIKELLDLGPIFSRDVIRADVPAALQALEFGASNLSEFPGALVRHIGIILGVKHQHFRAIDFVSMVPRIVEITRPELPPVRIR